MKPKLKRSATTRPRGRAISFRAIGTIRTPFRQPQGTPIQPAYAEDARGTVQIDPAFAAGLQDLQGFERIWLIYHLDRAAPARLTLIPYRDTREHGVFATRAPCRPNPIGLSCVQLLAVRGARLEVAGVDMLDGTPLLDIKPYVPEFECFPKAKAGWLDAQRVRRTRADRRFHDKQPRREQAP